MTDPPRITGKPDDAASTKLLDALRRMQAGNARRQHPRGIGRTFHAKTIAGVRATLSIPEGLPALFRHGLFAEARTYDAIVRFSSAHPWPRPDWVADGRGMSVRVFDVPGVPIEGEPPAGQDFLCLNGDVRFFADLATAARVMPLVQAPAVMPLRALVAMPPWRLVRMALDFAGIASRTFICLTTQDFFCAAPIAIGPSAGRISFHARHRAGPRLPFIDADGLSGRLEQRLAAGDISWEMRLQPYRDEQTTPISDLGIRWKPRDAPQIPVGELTLRPRGPAEADELRELVDRLAFSPWHAVEAHRPLGPIQEARRRAYAESARRRGAGGL